MGIFKLKKFCVLIPLLSFVITGCDTFKRKSLTVENVSNALNVVDDTLKHLDVDYTDYETKFGSGYSDIFGEFTAQDYVGWYPKAFNYDDEPFIQFRYAKGFLDEKGTDFVFGRKYYDQFDGREVYFDFYTGKKDITKDYDNIVACDVVVGSDIKVNTFNQIISNVVFQNTYVLSNGYSFSVNRYVNFLLDYEFGSEGINYLLKVYTRNDELYAPYVGYMTYQYDHIRVKNGSLVEFREFNIETSAQLALDDNHQSFDDYIKDNIAYRVDAVKWYVDGSYYVSKYMSSAKQQLVGNTLFSLGMFEPLTYATFLINLDDHESVDTTSVYNELSNSYGDDIIYAFLTKNPSTIPHINEENNPYFNPDEMMENNIIGIDACNIDGSSIPQYTVTGSTTFKSLFQGFVEADTSKNVTIPVWYVSNNGPVELINPSNIINTSKFTLYFEMNSSRGGTYDEISVNPIRTIKEAYEACRDEYDIVSDDVLNTFNVIIYEKASGFSTTVSFKFGDSMAFLDLAMEFPQVLIDYGLPKYTGTDVQRYRMENESKYENGYGCYISAYSSFNQSSYIAVLQSRGFTRYSITYTGTGNTYLYYKAITDNTYLFVKFSYVGKTGDYPTYFLRTYQVLYSDKSNLSSTFPSYLVTAGLPNYKSDHATFDDSSETDVNIFIYDSNHTEVIEYCNDLIAAGFTIENYNELDGFVTFKTTYQEGKYFIYVRILYYEEENCDYFLKVSLVENPDYFKINTIYLTSYFVSWSSSSASSSTKLTKSGTYFYLQKEKIFLAGKSFKFIANEDWNMANPDSTYKGFGYDDVKNMNTYSEYFARGTNGEIIVKVHISLMIYIYVYDKYLEIYFEVTPADIYDN